MTNEKEKVRHKKRLKATAKVKVKKARVRSNIAKDLIVSGKYNQRIVKDKRGKKHDLNKMSFRDLVVAIQEIEDYGN